LPGSLNRGKCAAVSGFNVLYFLKTAEEHLRVRPVIRVDSRHADALMQLYMRFD
jgi:hypothetical protein